MAFTSLVGSFLAEEHGLQVAGRGDRQGLPDEARPENVRTMRDAVGEYGILQPYARSKHDQEDHRPLVRP
jgi:hypothetical protein